MKKYISVAALVLLLLAAVVWAFMEFGGNSEVTTNPTIPTTAPTNPTAPTTKPTIPTEPTAKPTIPVEPTTKPTAPTTKPTEPTTKPTVPVHEHSYTSVVTKPTCTEKGYTTYTCICGDSYKTDEKPATGHNWGAWKVVLEATEEAPGKEERACVNCDAKENREIPKLEHTHSYSEKVTKEPSCTEDGIKTFSCKCGDSYTEKIAKLEHQYSKKVTKPTCTEKGYTTYTCSACGDSYKTDEKPATGHSWGKWSVVLEATEEAPGREERACANCDAKEDRQIPKLEHTHSYTEKVTKEPSCTEEGIKTFSCKCGESYTEKIAKLEHQYSKKVTKPTCTEKGYTTYTCICGDSYKTDEKPATGHSWGKWSVVLEATEEAPGREERTCSNCDAKEDRQIPKLEHTHSYTEKVTKKPSCTEEGIKTFSCKCGDSYTEKIAKLEHNYSAQQTIRPTCLYEGQMTYTCACGDSYTEVLPKTGHAYIPIVTKPSCTTQGYTTYQCICGDKYRDNFVPVIDHKWSDWIVTLQPTADAEGEAERTCSMCGGKETKVLDKGQHVHSYEVTVVAPTCEDQGYTLHSCICGDSFKDNFVKEIGHNSVHTVIPATCDDYGYDRYVCQNCGMDKKFQNAYPLGHDYSEWEVTKEPTATESGTQERECARCHDHQTIVLFPKEEEPETYIDPKLEIDELGHYKYGKLSVSDVDCVYDCHLSITVLENDAFYIVYYKIDGTKVEYTLEVPNDGATCWFKIKETGDFHINRFPPW